MDDRRLTAMIKEKGSRGGRPRRAVSSDDDHSDSNTDDDNSKDAERNEGFTEVGEGMVFLDEEMIL